MQFWHAHDMKRNNTEHFPTDLGQKLYSPVFTLYCFNSLLEIVLILPFHIHRKASSCLYILPSLSHTTKLKKHLHNCLTWSQSFGVSHSLIKDRGSSQLQIRYSHFSALGFRHKLSLSFMTISHQWGNFFSSPFPFSCS